ncbi:C40 family peptidase [Salinicola avicenniae]|uniref:C40 family peptidase n=1 Tax=Salinicola avicenniae TaxID=2916836 RepID=UPI0020738B46|nr:MULTISPECIES: C40 family peptidase [unclassified Salinicola]
MAGVQATDRARIGVAVAGLWRSPDAPRGIDAPALEQPPRLEPWLAALDDTTRARLCHDKLLVTQALLDTPVRILERSTDSQGRAWCRIVVPDQPSSQDPRGYPGWLPADQLVADSTAPDEPFDAAARLSIAAPTAWLRGLPNDRAVKLSFQTRLRPAEPLGEPPAPDSRYDAERVYVRCALGRGYLPRDTVRVDTPRPPATAAMLETLGRRFAGLRYLWAGNSSFGYDCSGLVHTLFAAVGIRLPRDTGDQVETGQIVPIDRQAAGDLLFFEKPDDSGRLRVDHVALYLGGDRMLHAPTNNARIECRRLSGSDYHRQLCAVRRYLPGQPSA